MLDKFLSNSDSVSAPARELFLIVPHATREISPLPKAVRANTDGDVVLRAVDSAADVTVTMTAGEILPVRAKYVRVAGTTVTSLHGAA